eukprot:403349158
MPQTQPNSPIRYRNIKSSVGTKKPKLQQVADQTDTLQKINYREIKKDSPQQQSQPKLKTKSSLNHHAKNSTIAEETNSKETLTNQTHHSKQNSFSHQNKSQVNKSLIKQRDESKNDYNNDDEFERRYGERLKKAEQVYGQVDKQDSQDQILKPSDLIYHANSQQDYHNLNHQQKDSQNYSNQQSKQNQPTHSQNLNVYEIPQDTEVQITTQNDISRKNTTQLYGYALKQNSQREGMQSSPTPTAKLAQNGKQQSSFIDQYDQELNKSNLLNINKRDDEYIHDSYGNY